MSQYEEPQIITEDAELDFPELNRELDKTKSKTFLGRNAAFLGSLMSTLEFYWTYSIPTAGTDGIKFYWNPKDFLMLPPEERRATIEHELWHCARLHMLRLGNRDPKKWNIACDIRINRDLRKEGYVLNPPMWIPDFSECPFEVEEDIYDWLDQNPSKCPLLGSGGGNQDDHMLPAPKNGKQTLVNNVVKAMHQHKMSKTAGNLPGGIEETIDTFLAPVIPWEVVLRKFFSDMLTDEYTWRRPNRRYSDIYLPSRFTDDGRLEHLAYYYDVSGSITDSQKIRISSELKYIKDTFNPAKLTIIEFDTRISKVIEVKDDEAFDSVKIVGGGGTSLVPVREHIMETNPTAAVIFSDLEVPRMEPVPNTIPIIWIRVGNSGHVPTFGKVINIKD